MRETEKGGLRKKPALIPVFYRLGVREAPFVYDENYIHRDAIFAQGSSFFEPWRQAECSTNVAKQAMSEIVKFSGVEKSRMGGGEDLSTAALVEATIQQVVRFFKSNT